MISGSLIWNTNTNPLTFKPHYETQLTYFLWLSARLKLKLKQTKLENNGKIEYCGNVCVVFNTFNMYKKV